jgi:hypothetical protein
VLPGAGGELEPGPEYGAVAPAAARPPVVAAADWAEAEAVEAGGLVVPPPDGLARADTGWTGPSDATRVTCGVAEASAEATGALWVAWDTTEVTDEIGALSVAPEATRDAVEVTEDTGEPEAALETTSDKGAVAACTGAVAAFRGAVAALRGAGAEETTPTGCVTDATSSVVPAPRAWTGMTNCDPRTTDRASATVRLPGGTIPDPLERPSICTRADYPVSGETCTIPEAPMRRAGDAQRIPGPAAPRAPWR